MATSLLALLALGWNTPLPPCTARPGAASRLATPLMDERGDGGGSGSSGGFRLFRPLRGVVVSTKNVLLGKGVGRDDDKAPAVLSEEVCLVPGSPVVRVESAPGNARRIFTGIDIVANSEDVLEEVWGTLTDYARLAEVVPNLVANEVLSSTDRGARLKQLGAAKLAPGITFTATTTLDVVSGLHMATRAPLVWVGALLYVCDMRSPALPLTSPLPLPCRACVRWSMSRAFPTPWKPIT